MGEELQNNNSKANIESNDNEAKVLSDFFDNWEGQFVIDTIHDLRSHLNVIISAVQFMQYNAEKNNENTKYIDIVRRNSYKMLKLINNIIDSNKLNSDYYKLNKINVDIVPLIEGTINGIAKYAQMRNISLVFDTNEEECLIYLDPEAIDRVIMNLVSNAIKFSNDNSNIYVNLSVYEDRIEISVKDEGCGISSEDKDKIFNRFYQAKERTEATGSGIGLNLSYCLVKAHGGEILINSEINKGSEFVVKLPREINKDAKVSEVNGDLTGKVQRLEIEFSDIYLLEK